MGESESRPIIFETGIYYSSKSKTIIYFCVVFSLLFPPIPVLCNHVFLLFQAWEARALTEEDRGPQQVEIFLPSFPFFRSARDISGGGGGGRRG